MAQRPTSVIRSIQLIWLMVAVALAATVLALVFDDELIAAWSAGHPADSAIEQPAFTPVAVVLFVVFAGLILVWLPFLQGGHNWARHSIAALVVFVALATVGAVQTNLPTLFVVGSYASLLVDAALLYFLYHRDTTRFVKTPDRELV